MWAGREDAKQGAEWTLLTGAGRGKRPRALDPGEEMGAGGSVKTMRDAPCRCLGVWVPLADFKVGKIRGERTCKFTRHNFGRMVYVRDTALGVRSLTEVFKARLEKMAKGRRANRN